MKVFRSFTILEGYLLYSYFVFIFCSTGYIKYSLNLEIKYILDNTNENLNI